MKKTLLIFLSLLFLNFGFSQHDFYSIKKVVIDAGHGGKDAGAIGQVYKVYEKNVVLPIALKLGGYIKKAFPEIEIIYTRDSDIFIPLQKRAEIANKAKADLFISVHANSLGKKRPDIRGTETYILGLHKSKENLDVAKMENAVISLEEDQTKYEGFDNSAESYIIFSMMQNEFLEQSAEFASLIENDFKTRAGRKSRGVRQAGFWVLYKTAMPSVLVEAGYLSNKKEERFLSSKKGQSYIASSIYRAFKKYKTNVENRSKALYSLQDDKVRFYVQIKSSKVKLKSSTYFKYNLDEVEEKFIDDKYRYVVGPYSSYSLAKARAQKLQQNYKGSFVIAVENNATITISEALGKSN